MTPKRRFAETLRFHEPDDLVSFMELEFHLYREYVGRFPVVGKAFADLPQRERSVALADNAAILVETARRAGHDAIRTIGGFWEVAPGVPALLWLPDAESELAQLAALREAAGEEFYLLGTVYATLGIPDAAGLEAFAADLFERPGSVHEKAERVLDGACAWQERLLAAGADGIVNCCDVALTNGPLLSPSQCEEFLLPYLARWTDSLRRRGVLSIWHTDGNILPLLPGILASGLDALQCLDPIAGIDVVRLKEEVDGRLSLIGNIDCGLLQLGTDAQVEAEARRVLAGCARGGGFVLGCCNAVFEGIPVERYETLVRTRRTWGPPAGHPGEPPA